MHYKGKVIDTATAPLTINGTSVKESTKCDYTEDDNHTNMRDLWKSESDGGSSKGY